MSIYSLQNKSGTWSGAAVTESAAAASITSAGGASPGAGTARSAASVNRDSRWRPLPATRRLLPLPLTPLPRARSRSIDATDDVLSFLGKDGLDVGRRTTLALLVLVPSPRTSRVRALPRVLVLVSLQGAEMHFFHVVPADDRAPATLLGDEMGDAVDGWFLQGIGKGGRRYHGYSRQMIRIKRKLRDRQRQNVDTGPR